MSKKSTETSKKPNKKTVEAMEEARTISKTRRNKRLEQDKIQEAFGAAYQIISHLAGESGVLDDPEVHKALEFFNSAAEGNVNSIEGILPFTVSISKKSDSSTKETVKNLFEEIGKRDNN